MKVFLQWNRFGDSCCREMIHFTGDCSSKLAHTHHPEDVMPHSWAKSRWNRPEDGQHEKAQSRTVILNE